MQQQMPLHLRYISEGVDTNCFLAEKKLGGEEKSNEPLDGQLHHNLHKRIFANSDHEESEEEIENDVCGAKEPSRTSSDEEIEVLENSSDHIEKNYIFRKKNLSLSDLGEDEATSVPSEKILRRINSKKGIKLYQLGKQLSCKWTTWCRTPNRVRPRLSFRTSISSSRASKFVTKKSKDI
ncbi:IQ domain-containing protein IQM2-like [Canna indica]|uniref:IQ domain-containing protein IQM2-like n=1 Tax=Canna indica TaxID=4628 RepID=A0AAQ3KZ27_9LILI|nr:IQ domain-containing protein IQM2-like [Canna indica]